MYIDLVTDHHREEWPSRDVGADVIVPEIGSRIHESKRDELPDTSRLCGRINTWDQVQRRESQ